MRERRKMIERIDMGEVEQYPINVGERNTALVTVQAPSVPEEAEWFLHYGEEVVGTGKEVTVFADTVADIVVVGGDAVNIEDAGGEVVLGVVWYENDGGEWVQRDATQTLTFN